MPFGIDIYPRGFNDAIVLSTFVYLGQIPLSDQKYPILYLKILNPPSSTKTTAAFKRAQTAVGTRGGILLQKLPVFLLPDIKEVSCKHKRGTRNIHSGETCCNCTFVVRHIV